MSDQTVTAGMVRLAVDKGELALEEMARTIENCRNDAELVALRNKRNSLRARIRTLNQTAYDELGARDNVEGVLLLRRLASEKLFTTNRARLAYEMLADALKKLGS
jgi:hypothetical protein